MPPRGRKAFVSRSAAAARAAAAGSDSDEGKAAKGETEPIDGAATTDADAGAEEKEASAAPAPSAAAPAAPAGSDDDDEDSGGGKETRGQMLQRHKRETKAQKEASKRLGKKKKDEAAAAEAALLARHEAELKALDDGATAAAAGSSGEAAADSLSRFKLDENAAEKHPPNLRKGSKAARRRAERTEREAAREAKRDAERAAVAGTGAGSVEAVELRARVLGPLGLEVHDVPADGHCLYAALSHQLKLVREREGATGGNGATPSSSSAFEATVSSLRALAAKHIRAHAQDFEPFIDDDEVEGGEGEGGEGEGGEETSKIERYCTRLEATAAWGGQPELQALAEALPAKIKVLSAGMDPVVVEGGSGEKEVPELTICYLRHAFGLGEHYNSTVAALPADDDASSAEEEEGGEGGGDE